jgi:hypothetical protein
MPVSLPSPVTSPATAQSVPLPPPTQITNRGWLIVRLVLGALLVVTATLKMSGGSSEALRSAMPFVSPRLYASGVMAELILGAWLITGLAPAWSWLSSLGFFGLLAYMSFQLGITGQASCGCLGKVHVSPWWAFGVDVAAMASLFLAPPTFVVLRLRQQHRFAVASIGASGLAVLALSLFAGQYVSTLTGNPLSYHLVSPVNVSGRSGTTHSLTIRLYNHSDTALTIVGGTSDCACIATDDLPLAIPGQSHRDVRVRIRLTGTTGKFSRRFRFFTGGTELQSLTVAVTGNITEG